MLPPLYAAWMEKILPGAIPSESKATCDKCAMCDHSEERRAARMFFNPQTKCCTYLPILANFLVGGVLSDDDPALGQGRASVEARLAAKIAATPLGLAQFPLYALRYPHALDAFGRSQTMRCPHYVDEDGGLCGIWRHRNAVCTTWFCKHERGATGQKFWDVLQKLLTQVEVALSHWCVLELDVGVTALESLFPIGSAFPQEPKLNAGQIDQVPDLEAYRRRWGTWLGREHEFYRECARLVNDLHWQDVARICGPEVQVSIKLTQEAYRRLTSDEIPEALRLRPVHIIGLGPDRVQLRTYSANDPLQVPRKVLDVLPYLESQPTSEALQTIEDEKKLRLSRSLLLKLIDFEVLTAKPGGGPRS